jgi:diketogulonate reductase-like aldo/keto reductase
MRSFNMPSGGQMPAFGIGTWRMGESARRRAQELEAVKYAIELGYPMIDTAEMYGDGGAEEIIGEALAGHRQRPFIVSKVYPHNATRVGHRRRLRAQPQTARDRAHRSLSAALARRRPPRADIRGIPSPARKRKIADFGVSNFDTTTCRTRRVSTTA